MRDLHAQLDVPEEEKSRRVKKSKKTSQKRCSHFSATNIWPVNIYTFMGIWARGHFVIWFIHKFIFKQSDTKNIFIAMQQWREQYQVRISVRQKCEKRYKFTRTKNWVLEMYMTRAKTSKLMSQRTFACLFFQPSCSWNSSKIQQIKIPPWFCLTSICSYFSMFLYLLLTHSVVIAITYALCFIFRWLFPFVFRKCAHFSRLCISATRK